MFTRKTPPDPTKLDEAIEEALVALSPYDDDYADKVKAVETLHKMKQTEASPRVSPDTMALIAANLAGIVLIVGHERAHVVTSKAVGFLMKLR